jgi:predicted metal-dependent peptidase
MVLTERAAFDESITYMTSAHSQYFKEYVFYMHLISQCKVVFDETMHACAGVGFHQHQYVLHLNPSKVIAEGKDKKGNSIVVGGFNKEMPIKHRLGVLKHEMLHIALGHLLRVEDRDFNNFNIASDCALNQSITRDHLLDYAIHPDNFPGKKKVPTLESAEFYYTLLEDEEKKKKKCGDGNGGEGQPSAGEGTSLGEQVAGDAHSKWKEISEDPTLQKEFTKNMVERAAESTRKQVGSYPVGYDQMISNLTVRREVDWKRELRKLIGNKKTAFRKTLLRNDRRNPKANWLKGRVTNRTFELAAISDVSGSVSDTALLHVWGEVINACKLFNTPITIVQVDTQPCDPEPLTKRTSVVQRKACGGTILFPGVERLRETNTRFDALLVTTDGYLNNSDIDDFLAIGKPVIWLIEPKGQIMEKMNSGKMRAIKLSEKYNGRH